MAIQADARTSADERRAHKATLAALLLLERRALVFLRHVVDPTRARIPVDPLEAAKVLGARIADATRAIRGAARREGMARLQAEWLAVKRRLEAAGAKPPDRLPAPAAKADLDALHAQRTGNAYEATVLRKTADAMGMNEGPSVAHIVRQAESTLTSIATTEVSSAFSDERAKAMALTVATYKAAEWVPMLHQVWDATLDQRTCSRCSALDGAIRPWGGDFPGGAVPGQVHPRCRCQAMPFVVHVAKRLVA